jgi:hydroxymethylglutaryl-CoA lyase
VNLPKTVTICEVGPRDGFQPEKSIIATTAKADIINRVAASGVPVIEIGAFVHPKAVPQMADTDEVARKVAKYPGAQYRALVSNRKGVERAIACGMNWVKLTHSASESHNLSNFNQPIASSVKGFEECLELAKTHGITASAAISVAFGCPFEGKIPLANLEVHIRRLTGYGIREISLSDTTGMGNPVQVYSIASHMVQTFPEVKWILHMHDTRGMALPNILAAMEAGISSFDASFAGLGGCPYAPGASGNIATEDLVHMLHEMGVNTGIDLDLAIENARLAKAIVGHETDSRILKAGKIADLILKKPCGQTKIG